MKKNENKFFSSLNYSGIILSSLSLLLFIAFSHIESMSILFVILSVLSLFIIGQILIVIFTVSRIDNKLTLKKFTAITMIRILVSVWDFASFILVLPFIAMIALSGFVMGFASLIGIIALVIFFIERVLGYELENTVSIIETPLTAIITLLIVILGILYVSWQLFSKKGGTGYIIYKTADFNMKIRQKIQGMEMNIRKEADGQ